MDESRHHPWTTQAFGLSLISAALVVVLVLTFLLFEGEDAGILVVIAAVVFAATVLVRRVDQTWAKALGLVATLLSLGGFFLAFGVFQLFSPIEFVVGLAYVFGVFLSLGGGISAIRAGRKSGGSARGGRLRKGVAVFIGAAAVVSVVGFFLTREAVSDAEAAGATTIGMENFEFVPNSSIVRSDGKLLIRNSDAFVHDFTLDELGLFVSLGPGSESLLDLNGLALGTYDYFCSLHTNNGEGMTGTVTIEG